MGGSPLPDVTGSGSGGGGSGGGGGGSGGSGSGGGGGGGARRVRFRVPRVVHKKKQVTVRSVGLVLQHAPFCRMIRDMVDTLTIEMVMRNGARFQPAALHALHKGCEEYMMKLLKAAQTIAVHAGRVTVRKEDLLVARSVDTCQKPLCEKATELRLPTAGLLRLCRAAGIERASEDLVAMVKKCIDGFLKAHLSSIAALVMARASAAAVGAGRQSTITTEDVAFVLRA